jgi:hypothetical protein
MWPETLIRTMLRITRASKSRKKTSTMRKWGTERAIENHPFWEEEERLCLFPRIKSQEAAWLIYTAIAS